MSKESHDDDDSGDDHVDDIVNNGISSSLPSKSVITKILNELVLVQAGEHNILTFQEMQIMKEIRSRYCCELLTRRNMEVILIPYVESTNEVIADLAATSGEEIDINRHIADGSLVIESDAHLLIDSYAHGGSGFHNYIQDLQTHAKQKGKEGLGIVLDISSLLLMDDIEKLLKFESEVCPKNHPELEHSSLLCCYNGFLFDKIERAYRETIFNNHHRKLCALTTS
jgi:hypothetical protein